MKITLLFKQYMILFGKDALKVTEKIYVTKDFSNKCCWFELIWSKNPEKY